MSGVRRFFGTGGYHTGERHMVASPLNRGAGRPLVVVCHGAGADGWHSGGASERLRWINTLARAGMVVVSADLGSTVAPIDGWGNDTAVARVDEAITWAAAEWDVDTGRVFLIGDSAGGATALNWARANNARVAAIALRLGVADVSSVYDAGNPLLVGLIDQAYGGGLDLPGTAGAYASTPDHASLDITGDIDIRADVALDDWTPAVVASLVNKFVTNDAAYQLRVNTAGTLRLTWSANGTVSTALDSTAGLSALAAGARQAVRVTLDVDNGAAGKTAMFYTAPTIAGPWTQLGAPVVQAGTTSIFASTAPLEVGSRNIGGADLAAGTVRAVEVRDGIDGTVVANPDFTAHQPGTLGFTDGAGRAWTINGAATVTPGWNVLAATHDPALNAAELAPIADRLRFYYSSNDSLIPPQGTVDAAAAIGCQAISLGAVDHDPYDVWPDATVSAWFWSHVGGA